MVNDQLLSDAETRAVATAVLLLTGEKPAYLFGVPIVLTFPEGLPEGWTMEQLRKVVGAYAEPR